jgi:hypothetical protein
MSYTDSDPRSTLAVAPSASRSTEPNVAPQYFEFHQLDPSEVLAGGTRSWWSRSQAIIVCYSDAAVGDTLERSGQIDEYVVLLPAPIAATVRAAGESVDIDGERDVLVVVPPGDSSIEINASGPVVRLFSSQSTDLADRCLNASFYDKPDPHVAPWAPWPESPDGHRIRAYPVDDYPAEKGRFGRIFRCSTFMINWFADSPGPRPVDKMSPHHHDDFEQLSLQLAGDYVHHIRTSWTPDMRKWRDDEHRHCTSPSVTVIPPPSIHTSQSVGDTSHVLVDIFAPPRHDFSAKDGWVLNDSEYPIPES